MLHFSVSSSIFYYYSTFLRPLVNVLFWGNRLGRKGTAIFYTSFYDAKKELEMLWDEKVEISRRSFIPFSSSSLTDLLFFGQNATQHLQTIFVCVPTFHLFLSDGVQFQQKLFVCNFASYLSVNIYSSSTFSYVSLAWWYPTLCPLKSSLKWLISDNQYIQLLYLTSCLGKIIDNQCF